ncbi:hypothetical protein AMECASPLE_030174, partial [Ameca splendens]
VLKQEAASTSTPEWPSVARNLNFGFTLLITDFVSGGFWTNKITYVLRTSSPNNCFHLDSDPAGSFLLPPFPGRRLNLTLSTLQRKISVNLDSEFLYHWRPDHIYLSNNNKLTSSQNILPPCYSKP